MPQMQQSQVHQQQRQSPLGGIIRGLTGIASAFLPPGASQAANFLAGAATQGGGQTSSASVESTQGNPQGQQQEGPPEPDDNAVSPQPPEQQQQDFVGPQVAQGGVPEQIPGQATDAQPDLQKRQQEQIFGMIEKNVPDLPFMVQQNPNLLPGFQNFLSQAQQRWMNQNQQGDGQ